jgi:hypothetical protein
MILLNFSHPLTADHLAQVEALTGRAVERVADVPVQIDVDRNLAEQVAEIVDGIGMSSEEWQSLPLLVNLPGYAPAAAVLLAELHGRMGYWPTIMRQRAVSGSLPTRYEVAEMIGLQEIRDAARERRSPKEERCP